MLQQVSPRVNIDVCDLLDQAHAWGYDDATDGNDQRGAAYFPIGSPAWHAYNEGYAEGCIALAVLTGEQRPYWCPTLATADVSWNTGVQHG